MGVPAFYRWLSEKYPKIVEDVLEERTKLAPDGVHIVSVDATQPNPSGLETDNLYIDMNGIIHPCSHPEHGPQPKTEEAMYENVCRYVDHLFQVVRPRKLLYLAIDGVAPRAKMNQQRSRRFRSAQEARELAEIEEHVRTELESNSDGAKPPPPKKAWDSNVITPGTHFMLGLSEYIRFYIRKRISTNRAWQGIRVHFSDASIPGEGEHKIMSHIRLQRSQPGYNPNLVHVLHGLDADLIMLALATHEVNFYILREVVTFGRRSVQAMEQRQLESGFTEQQRALDERVGEQAMELAENSFKPLQRVCIPVLREYLATEFASLLQTASLERVIDDVVFLCFFVGNDFLPHLPSLDIRDGALDYLFNVYKRILPTLGGDYITNHGGTVNLSHVDVILAEVGAIEDLVFTMKYENEQREAERKRQAKEQRKQRGHGNNKDAQPPIAVQPKEPRKVMGRAARIMEKRQQQESNNVVALQRGHEAKQSQLKKLKVSHLQQQQQTVKSTSSQANAQAALELKKSLLSLGETKAENDKNNSETMDTAATDQVDDNAEPMDTEKAEKDDVVDDDEEAEFQDDDVVAVGTKRKAESKPEAGQDDVAVVDNDDAAAVDEDVDDDDDDEDVDATSAEEYTDEQIAAAAKQFKEKVKAHQDKQLDEYAKNVEDKVRLHQPGWKDRYYTDKCKADDVANHGGREHLFRSYVMGLCWVMKYYYEGCPSWKWYYPFHYAPFASDLRNIERFEKDCRSFELNEPFRPVEQLMAVLPEDSSHAIPKEARWLMAEKESPIIDFYPKDVLCDPNGKAMPWLWVVLLPFIEEDRLLEAMKPTMAKWTKKELLCNARGLDDGYIYVHTSNALAPKLTVLFEPDKKESAKSSKTRLTDVSRVGFTGSIRLPLSNEVYSLDETSVIPPPASSDRIDRSSHDNLFSDPIEPNCAVCVAFTEPARLPHKSILLPGAVVPPPKLTQHDMVIRRPRLNRGGRTIANMGGAPSGSGASHQSGYGSMNISSYERDLAKRTGRGAQMYQTGNRAWGSMEPTPKRQRFDQGGYQQPPYQPNPFSQTHSAAANTQNYGSNRPPWQQNHNYQGNRQPQHQGHSRHNGTPSYQQQQQRNRGNQWQQGQHGAAGYASQQQQQHQQRQGQGGRYQQRQGYPGSQPRGSQYQNQQRPPPPPPPPQHRPQFSGQPHQQSQYGYSFNRPNQQRNNNQPSRVNPNLMSNLRSQLASTLQQNRRGRGDGRGS